MLVATMGVCAARADYEPDFMGAPMYWIGFDNRTNRRLVRNAWLTVLQAREETEQERGDWLQPMTGLSGPSASSAGRLFLLPWRVSRPCDAIALSPRLVRTRGPRLPKPAGVPRSGETAVSHRARH
jgi:hypothetical protein